ncbi:hypothetical protein JR312_00015 [Wolbachia endosymbiont of Nasonia giraulti]
MYQENWIPVSSTGMTPLLLRYLHISHASERIL